MTVTAFRSSHLTLRNSYVGGNHVSGVAIVAFGAGATANSDMSGIDLGTSSSQGYNVLQDATDLNRSAGVCIGVAASGQTLSAVGDLWGGVNCSTGGSGGALTHTAGCGATSGVDLGGIGTGANANTAAVSSCTLQ